MALIKCPECSTEVSENAPSCIKCGYPIRDIIKCPACGTYNAGKPAACARCGCPFEEAVAATASPATKSGGSEGTGFGKARVVSNKWVWALAGVPILFVLIFFVGRAWFSSGAPKGALENQRTSKATTGSFTDARDGKTYKTMKIGKYTWMAENLNYKTSYSWCYDNDNSNCAKYGRLYTWGAAKDACPSGWLLPNNAEWNNFMEAVGGVRTIYEDKHESYVNYDGAGKRLKSKSGWNQCNSSGNKCVDNGNGADGVGFSALPGGSINPPAEENQSLFTASGPSDEFGAVGILGFWWSATEHGRDKRYKAGVDYAYHWVMSYRSDDVSEYISDKDGGLSVRCAKETGLESAATAQTTEATRGWGAVLSVDSVKVNKRFPCERSFHEYHAVIGKYPQISGLSDHGFQEKLNSKIKKWVNGHSSDRKMAHTEINFKVLQNDGKIFAMQVRMVQSPCEGGASEEYWDKETITVDVLNNRAIESRFSRETDLPLYPSSAVTMSLRAINRAIAAYYDELDYECDQFLSDVKSSTFVIADGFVAVEIYTSGCYPRALMYTHTIPLYKWNGVMP